MVLWKNPYVRGLTGLLLLLLAARFLYLTADLWGILLGALLLAALVRPLVDRLEGLRLPRSLALGVTLLLLSLGLGLLGVELVRVAEQLAQYAATLPGAAGHLADWWNRLPGWLHASGLPLWLVGALEQAYGSLGQLLQGLSAELIPRLGSFAQSGLVPALTLLFGGAVKLAAFVVLFIYLLADGPRMGRSLLQRLPMSGRAWAERRVGYLERAVMGYFRGQLLVALSLGVLVGLGLGLLGVPLALPLGMLVGVLELIPYLGLALGAVMVVFAALPLGGLMVLKALLVLLGAAQLEGHLLAPLLVGQSTSLHPVTVLLALLLGERLAGVLGMLVAVPLTAALKLWLEDFWPWPPLRQDKGVR
ncbi:sporulation integral membrane protein YtvI [Calidithermus roseus]|uniref:Sporulation integral membrane protein YtvI n=1 Tax=Calidithermus roseus TaxID=1644118 RepID=A0A399F1M4_9DEIN|nr:sporulation integral membrane protein YtvI [Calidithermus roseus]